MRFPFVFPLNLFDGFWAGDADLTGAGLVEAQLQFFKGFLI
jgi:hypothetical protein